VRPRAVRLAPAILLSLVLLTGGWSLLWFFARYEAQAAFGQWLASERSFGRVWSCPNQGVGGYPLGIVLTCDQPTLKGEIGDGVFQGDIAGLRAEARLYFPTNVTVTFVSPLHATEVGGTRRIDASWSAATLSLRGLLPDNLDRGLLQVEDLQIDPAGGTDEGARIGHVELAFKPVTRAADARADLETTFVADNARIPALDAALGTADPMGFRLKGFATQVKFDGGMTLRDVLDPWSHAGGQLHIQSFSLDKGAFAVKGSGRLGLDEDHRVEGRLDTGFSGLGPIAAKFGLPLDAVKLGSALSGLLGGKTADSDAPASDIALPVVAKGGRLYVGPLKTGIALVPLY
jgi:hypothetical protein